MNKKDEQRLQKILTAYFKELHKIYVGGNFREESFYPSLKELIEKCAYLSPRFGVSGVLVQPRKTEAGIPDFLIRKDGTIIGYIEAKSPDTNLRDVEESEQLKRYRSSLPNLILTNFLEFRIYRRGDITHQVEVGRQFTLNALNHPPVPEKLGLFFELLEKFFSFSIPEIRTSSDLSVELAKRARFLVTYGLFAARMRIEDGFKKDIAWQLIPESLPLLKEIFHSFTGPHFPESLLWVVDDISQVLDKADVASILKEFKATRWDEDPVIHFYETFLATYNPKERQRLGVYYTPLPVVSYIVRSIHLLLKDRFRKPEGFATGDVTILDPAAGTLTFVVQAIKQVQTELETRKKGGLIKSCIEEHILPHFHAFEILMAPYTVGHFKVSRVLEEMGYNFKEDERFQFYLTNTLEMKEPKQRSFLIDLAKEGQEAKRIKEKVPVLVVLGNPPYSVSSENKSEFIEELMDDYKKDVRAERNLQPLSDDYIKFIRFAHWKIEHAGRGILGFITNNAYLSGIIHRGMRRMLIDTFDEIYILNLHGSSRIGEKTPEGGKDENVFDIQQGVAIAIYVKWEKPPKEKKVYYADIWGKRREDKYPFLQNNDVNTTRWQELKPVVPHHFFIPKDFALQEEYDKFWKITEIFKKWSSGIGTYRDYLVIGFTKEDIAQRVRILTGNLSDDLVEQALNIKNTRSWHFSEARRKIKNENLLSKLFAYAYRPFDIRWICYEAALIDRDRSALMQHFLEQNLGFVFKRSRYLKTKKFHHIFSIDTIGDINFFGDQSIFFPLYLYPNKAKEQLTFEDKSERSTNFTDDFLQAVNELLGSVPTPEEIFYYIYAILYSPAYRKRYEEFLKIDFPRIHMTSDNKAFKVLNNLGKELVDLHLLRHPALDETDIGFPESDSNMVEKIRYDEKGKRVYLNKGQYFEGISRDVWEYRIGAYKVMEKYLKDRKGRKLSLSEINHYMKVAKAIDMTIMLQENINKIYEKI
jgi:predicted helicase